MKNWFRRRPRLTQAVQENIKSVADLERRMRRQRTAVDRVSDGITRFAGSLRFVAAHAAAFAVWVLWNGGLVPGLSPFDPYPFVFLNFVLAAEAVFLSTFVLMSQNRQNRQSDNWAHLALQMSLLAEQETTKLLQMQRAVCAHLGLRGFAGDEELTEMVETTHVEVLAHELDRAREPDEAGPPP